VPSKAGSESFATTVQVLAQEGIDVDVEVEGAVEKAKGVDTHLSIAGDLKQISVQLKDLILR